jgi:hypothetical protein
MNVKCTGDSSNRPGAPELVKVAAYPRLVGGVLQCGSPDRAIPRTFVEFFEIGAREKKTKTVTK